MKRYAILLGAEEYEENEIYPTTSFCHDDVELLRNALINFCDFAEQDIYYELLTTFDERTPKDILEKISELVKDSEAGDTVLFYYAGHGDYVQSDSYLVLPHTKRENIKQTAIPLRDISSILRQNQRLNVRIFDCCHSGQDVRSSVEEKINTDDFTNDIINNNNNGWVTFASCGERENSYLDTALEHGVFTYFLVQAIEEYREGEDIIPEILKVNVCNKVADWCKANRKKQNPTFNASISGNISLGVRKSETHKSSLINTSKNDNINSQLIDRINAIRGSRKSDEEESRELFKKYILNIHEKFCSNKEKINTYNLNLIDTPPNIAEKIPYDITVALVKYFNSKKYDTFHKYKIEEKYEKDNTPSFMKSAFYTFEPKLLSANYAIEQEWGFPESYTDLTLQGDGYLPDAKVFVYVSPLQLTACIVSGISINEKTKIFNTMFIKTSEEIDGQLINDFVSDLIEKFNIEYKSSVEKFVKYYEDEIALVNDKLNIAKHE